MMSEPTLIYPQVKGTRWRLVQERDGEVKTTDWHECDSPYEGAANALAPNGEENIKRLTDSINQLRATRDELGKLLPPVKLSELMPKWGMYKDTAFNKFVSNWLDNYLPELDLNEEPHEYEREREHWSLIPLNRYDIEEAKVVDEGQEDRYWVVTKNGEIIDPDNECKLYVYDTDDSWPVPRYSSEWVSDEGRKGGGIPAYDLRYEAEEVALYLNRIATGQDRDEYPDRSNCLLANPAIPIELIQAHNLNVFDYTGPETRRYGRPMRVVDLSGYGCIYREEKLAQICASYCVQNGHTVETELGARYIDPFN